MSTLVSLSKAYIVDESDSPLAAIQRISKEIYFLENHLRHLKKAQCDLEVQNRDYLEIIKEFI